MLTLKRRINQTILIGGDIEMRVVALSAYEVELAFDLPNRTAFSPPSYTKSVGTGRKLVKIRRRRLQEVTINDSIEITVYQVSKTVVSLGITAPESVRIDRGDRVARTSPQVQISEKKGEAA